MAIDKESAKDWLRLAKIDLDSANKLAGPPDPIPSTCLYHCQQAAEKSAKAVLALNNEKVPNIHDVGRILELIEEYDERLTSFASAAEELTLYATEYRYPKAGVKPISEADVAKAISDAKEIFNLVSSIVERDDDPDRNRIEKYKG